MKVLKEILLRDAAPGADWQPHYSAGHSSWDAKEIQEVKQKVDAEIRQLHPAIQRLIRVQTTPQDFERWPPNYPGPYKTIRSPRWELEVCPHPTMLQYLDEPGARDRLVPDLERLDQFLAALNLHPEVLTRPNPDYVSPFKPGVRVIHTEHRDRGVGVIVGPLPEVPHWHQVRMPDGEILSASELMLERSERHS